MVHLIISTPPYTTHSSFSFTVSIGLLNSVLCKNIYSWLPMLPLTLLVNNSGTFQSHRPPLSAPPPGANTKRFFLLPEDPKFLVQILSEPFVHIQLALWWIVIQNQQSISLGYILSSGIRISQTLVAALYLEHYFPVLQLPCTQLPKCFDGAHYKHLHQLWRKSKLLNTLTSMAWSSSSFAISIAPRTRYSALLSILASLSSLCSNFSSFSFFLYDSGLS